MKRAVRSRVLLALPLVTAITLGTWLAISLNDSPEEAVAQAAPETGDRATGLVPLTPELCERAKLSAANGMETVRRQLASNPEAGEALRTWEQQYRETREWLDAGCPPDGKRGFIPNADGNGGQMIIFPNTVGFDGSTHYAGPGRIVRFPIEKQGD